LPENGNHDVTLFENEKITLPDGNCVDISDKKFINYTYKYPSPEHLSVCRGV